MCAHNPYVHVHCLHTYIHRYTSHMQTYMHTCTLISTHIDVRTLTHIDARTRTHTQTHTHTHRRTHTQTHTHRRTHCTNKYTCRATHYTDTCIYTCQHMMMIMMWSSQILSVILYALTLCTTHMIDQTHFLIKQLPP